MMATDIAQTIYTSTCNGVYVKEGTIRTPSAPHTSTINTQYHFKTKLFWESNMEKGKNEEFS